MASPPLDIPTQAPFTLATMEHTHARMEITPNGDAALSFDLALPKTWVYSKQFGPVSDALLVPRGLAFFASSEERGAPVVAVTVTTIPFEVPIDVWTRLSMESEGWTVVAGNWFPGPNGLFYDATGIRTVDDMQFVRRTSARVDATNVFSVNTMCAREFWDLSKENFWAAHVTFALLGATNETRMEPWLRTGAKAPDFETAHPISWKSEEAEAPSPDTSGVHLRLINADETTLLAYLLVRVERKKPDEQVTPTARLDETLQTLQRSGLTIKDPPKPLTEDEDPRSIEAKGWLHGYLGEGHLAEADVSVRIGFLERDGFVVTFVAYSPKLEDDAMVALRAQRAFEIARAKLKLA